MKNVIQNAEMSRTQINYYVCGEVGIGKSLFSKALARSLYPEIANEKDLYFYTGVNGAALKQYKGQPVIIWDNCNASDFLKEFHGRENVYNFFDTHPTPQKQKILCGSGVLCNTVNIINSVQPYEEFFDELSGEDIDKTFKAFPFIISLHENDFDLLVNKGICNGTPEYGQYIEYRYSQWNMAKIARMCGGNEKLAKLIQNKAVNGIVDMHHHVLDKITKTGI